MIKNITTHSPTEHSKLDEAIKYHEEMQKERYLNDETHKRYAEWLKELKGLRLLLDWAIECDFGYDNIPEEYAKYKHKIKDMDYTQGLIYIGIQEAVKGLYEEAVG